MFHRHPIINDLAWHGMALPIRGIDYSRGLFIRGNNGGWKKRNTSHYGM
jgi:hypothetical protein